jgi:hypothetical protein
MILWRGECSVGLREEEWAERWVGDGFCDEDDDGKTEGAFLRKKSDETRGRSSSSIMAREGKAALVESRCRSI